MSHATTDGPKMIHELDTLRAHLSKLDDILFGNPESKHSTWRDEARAAWAALDDLVGEVDQLRRSVYTLDHDDKIMDVIQCAQGVLTSLNIGSVQRESPLHKELRRVLIAYRALGTPASDATPRDPGDESQHADDQIPFGDELPRPNTDFARMARRHNRRAHALEAIQSMCCTLLDGNGGANDAIPPAAAVHAICAMADVATQALAFDGSIPSVAECDANNSKGSH